MSRWAPRSRIRRPPLLLATLGALALGTVACRESVAPGYPGGRADGSGRPALTQAPAADITLWPSSDGTGTADANAIEHALNILPAGGVIRLANGTFYLNRPVVAPVGFDGSLLGTGTDATWIVGVGSKAVPFANATMTTPGDFQPVEASSLFFFPRPAGELSISDLTMTLAPGFVTVPSTYGFTDLTGFVFVQLAPEGANTRLSHLRLVGVTSTGIGDPFPGVDYQPLWGVGVMGAADAFPMLSSGGHHSLTNSDISRVGIQATAYQLLKRAEVNLSDNVYRDVKQAIMRWLDGSNVAIERNMLSSYSFGSIVITQEGIPIPGDLSNIVVRNNDITVKGYLGIEIGFIPEATRPDFALLVEKNTIRQAGPDPIGFFPNFAAIGMADGQDRAVVRNNVLRGSALFAISAEGVDNSVFVGNNLQEFVSTLAGVALFGSNDNAVVGIGQGTVWDFGTGNIITGLTKASGDVSLGAQLRAGEQQRLQILRGVSHSTRPPRPGPDSGAVASRSGAATVMSPVRQSARRAP